MKKFMLVIIAAVMAVGFSAFTTAEKPLAPVSYHNGTDWVMYTGSLCPAGEIPECIKVINQVPRQLFYNEDFEQPVTRLNP